MVRTYVAWWSSGWNTWGLVEQWLQHVGLGGAVVRTCGAWWSSGWNMWDVVEHWLEHVGRGGAVVRTSVSQSIEPVFESSCCHFKDWAISFTPRCLSSLSCIINVY